MSRKTLVLSVAPALALAFGSIVSIPVQAGEAGGTAELKSVTVVAPRVVRREMQGRTQVEVVQKSAAVYHGDLDLSRTADVIELESRVIKAASDVCRDLVEQVPAGQPDENVCVSRAREDAIALVRAATLNAASRVASR